MTEFSILRLRAVCDRTGLSRTAIYNGMHDGTFPASIAIGKRSVGWSSVAVQAWLDARVRHTKAVRKAAVAAHPQ